MNSAHCCQRARRAKGVAGWLLPSTVLVLLPKCPLCLAAYVALGTGFMMTPASAHLLQRTLTLLCVAMLTFCAMKWITKYFRQKPSYNLQLKSTHR